MTRRVNSISKIINSLGTLVRDVIGDCHRSIEEIEGKKKKKKGIRVGVALHRSMSDELTKT